MLMGKLRLGLEVSAYNHTTKKGELGLNPGHLVFQEPSLNCTFNEEN